MISLGACACASAPGPKPIQGIPLRPMMDTPFVENVHLSVNGRALRSANVTSAPIRSVPYKEM